MLNGRKRRRYQCDNGHRFTTHGTSVDLRLKHNMEQHKNDEQITMISG